MSMTFPSSIAKALRDVGGSAGHLSLMGMLAWQDIRQRYRRSIIGPFWLTISMAVMVAIIQLVFGQIFRVPMQDFLPHVAVGLILWAYLSATWTEGCQAFMSAEKIIKQLPLPLSIHVFRTVWRNLLVLGHNLIILPVVFLALGLPVSWESLLSLIGLLLMTINLTWMALVLAVLCTRYRDLAQIVSSALQVLFHLTPIMWMPSLLPEGAGRMILGWNPLFHWLETVRGPLLGTEVGPLSWGVSLSSAVIGWLLACALFARTRARIAYWL
ncbi:MAG: lipopolysaccharide transport system permease protein [Betaproteobacteria bacterium]|nr:lipopolysaccharide transport system permease protein [Betaproteobacteria bacterium]